MNFLKNKSVAFLFLFICIGVAVFIGSPYSMSKKHSNIEMSFYAERGIYEHIEEKVSYASEAIKFTNDYLSTDNVALVALNQNIRDFSNLNYSSSSLFVLNANITNNISDIVLAAKRIANITENDAKNLDRILVNTEECDKMISNIKKDYNLQVENFNRSIDSFPGNIISTLAGVKPLPLF